MGCSARSDSIYIFHPFQNVKCFSFVLIQTFLNFITLSLKISYDACYHLTKFERKVNLNMENELNFDKE